MEMEFTDLVANSFWAIPLVTAIVQAIKMVGIPSKYSPLLSLAVGIGLSFFIDESLTFGQSVLAGVVYGLSASGLYSGIKHTQQVADVKSGEIPLSKVDKGLLTEQEMQEVQQKQQNQQNQNTPPSL